MDVPKNIRELAKKKFKVSFKYYYYYYYRKMSMLSEEWSN